MTSIFHSGLLKDISSLLNDADDFNVIIKAGDEYTKEFPAHSVILRARCPYFKKKNEPLDEKSTKKNTFNIPNITPTIFEMVLKYIYTGELDLTNHLGENILGLLVASDELLLEELVIHVQEYLIEEQAPWVQKNLVQIRPYKTVIPDNIYDEIEEYYFKRVQPKTINLTPRKKAIESNLIKPKLANIITSWIERKDEKYLSVKYKFDLLYRSSRDGLNINTFRTKCNRQGRCLVLVKHPDSAKIYGGYNPLNFVNANGQYYSTPESFIFSFENSEDIQYMKISRVQGSYSNYAIRENNAQGFNFGDTLFLSNNLNIYFNNSGYYDSNDRTVLNPYFGGNFVPAEIEVFKMKAS
ncbi:unnamed protein product [Rhizophagus irregularis]|nr:unnamed protein product [Rhizophagus irregularis]